MLGPVVVPPSQVIEQWQDIDDVPIFETVPSAVPFTSFVEYPNEGYYERILSTKIDPTIQDINSLQKNIETVEQFLAQNYCRRSLSAPLMTYIEQRKQELNSQNMPDEFLTKESMQIAMSLLEPQLEWMQRQMDDCIQINVEIARILMNNTLWSEGQYSSYLMDTLSFLIYRLTALEQLSPSEKGITNDISTWIKLSGDSQLAMKCQNVRMWFANVRSISMDLLKKLSDMKEEDFIFLFNLWEKYLHDKIEKRDFLIPDMEYAYITTYQFFLQLYVQQQAAEEQKLRGVKRAKPKIKEINDDVKNFSQAICDTYPNLLLYFEFASEISFNVPREMPKIGKKPDFKRELSIHKVTLDQLYQELQKNFSKLSILITKIIGAGEPNLANGKTIMTALPNVLRVIGLSLNGIRQVLSQVLANPPHLRDPEEEKKYSLFERSMRFGMGEHLTMMLLIICICRSTRELVTSNLPIINQLTILYTQNYIQDFVKNKLTAAIIRSSETPALVNIFTQIRTLLGYFTSTDEILISETKVKKLKDATLTTPKCGPRIDLLELARHLLEKVINPESEFVNKKSAFSSVPLDKVDQEAISDFLKETENFIAILRLQDTINIVADQSKLYFKEHYLGVNQVSFFPVRSSLPVILSEHALQNYQKPELTGAIFYPLSMYDDAASCALRTLKSRYLYEEIKAEARICLQSIVQLISEKAFHPIRKFASLQSISESLARSATDSSQKMALTENISALRLGVVLQQNQLYVLGCMIDTKSLIAEKMNDILNKELLKIVELTDKHGILSSIAVSKLVEILRATHNILLSFGLPLMPFEDLLARAFSLDTMNSLQSLHLINLASHLTETVIFDYYLLINPDRLIPKTPINLNVESLYVGSIGGVMQRILQPTASLMCLESFREAFRLLDEGAIQILHQQCLTTLDSLFESFKDYYYKLRDHLTRIYDSPASMNCRQAFDRYEGAYLHFLDEPDIHNIFLTMSQIGNVLAISELMDDAFCLKHASAQQIASFLSCEKPGYTNPDPDLFTLFDKEYQRSAAYFSHLPKMPTDDDVVPPFVSTALEVLAHHVLKEGDLFFETSPNLLDLQSLNGFAAIWSVLEFLFANLEINRKDGKGSIIQYGDGVQLCAAAILCSTRQRPLYHALCIGDRIAAHMTTDFSKSADEKLYTFVSVNKVLTYTLRCAMTSFSPAIERIVEQGQ